MLAADYPFLDVLWTMLVFFIWIAWFFMVIKVITDIFRRHDLSGGGKVGWLILVIVLPFLGVFIYLLTHGQSIAERDMAQAQAQRAQMDDYIRTTAGGGVAEIEQAKKLLDSGTITQSEFDQIKAKALAG